MSPHLADQLITKGARFPYWEDRTNVDDINNPVSRMAYRKALEVSPEENKKRLIELDAEGRRARRDLKNAKDKVESFYGEFARNCVNSSPIVDVTSVYIHIRNHPNSSKSFLNGALTPRWDQCWMEYRLSRSQALQFESNGIGIAIGVLDDSRTAYQILFYVDSQKNGLVGPVWDFRMELNTDGSIEKIESVPVFNEEEVGSPFEHGLFDPQKSELSDDLLAPFLMTLALTNCNNVDLIHVRAEHKVSRKWQKKTGKPLLEWTSITLTPLRNKQRKVYETISEDKLDHRRLHLVPGYFAHYGPKYNKGLLFGKYEGRFYIPSHVRGNEAEGILAHDYKVKI